jgi:hypothetical protein
MRYTISELLERAQAGNIGRKGLHRLRGAGYDAAELAPSGIASDAVPDVSGALDTRREGLFLRAIQRAQQQVAAGGEVSAGTQARLRQAPPLEGLNLNMETGALNEGSAPLSQLLENYRKRRGGALTSASIYDL